MGNICSDFLFMRWTRTSPALHCSFFQPSYSRRVLPEEITQIRERLGFSMSRLAREIGTDPDVIVDWESGQKFPTKKHAEALRRLLQMTDKSAT